ncbi:MAG TPA: hypothetical protein EYP85_09045 [Armatimonadetes bacterium]|nr:hypothetical protein [Armatimonadota bacterium]
MNVRYWVLAILLLAIGLVVLRPTPMEVDETIPSTLPAEKQMFRYFDGQQWRVTPLEELRKLEEVSGVGPDLTREDVEEAALRFLRPRVFGEQLPLKKTVSGLTYSWWEYKGRRLLLCLHEYRGNRAVLTADAFREDNRTVRWRLELARPVGGWWYITGFEVVEGSPEDARNVR